MEAPVTSAPDLFFVVMGHFYSHVTHKSNMGPPSTFCQVLGEPMFFVELNGPSPSIYGGNYLCNGCEISIVCCCCSGVMRKLRAMVVTAVESYMLFVL